MRNTVSGAALTLLLSLPVGVGGCGAPSSREDICSDTGEACGWSDAQIDECKAGFTKSRSIASNVGCGVEFASFESCVVDHYETPEADACNENTLDDAEIPCATEESAYVACVTEKCSAQPEKCTIQ